MNSAGTREAYTAQRARIHLGPQLARGGEATVHRVEGRPDLVAKIYSKARDEMREKLLYMRASPPQDPARGHGHASIAWPSELLFDRGGRFIGYSMPYVRDAVSMLEVFNPKRRAKVLPGFDARYLHRTARNLASALAALHARDYVVGDLNEQNVLVTPRTLVTLIDTDSFQVQQQRHGQIVVYPCPVGRSEYTPPELQSRAFKGTMRRPEHDSFGLAVLIFQLLMGGSHPYRGRWLADGHPPPLEEKIAKGLLPWDPDQASRVAPPPGMPALETLHPELVELVMGAFVDGHANPALRPPAEAWAEGLAEAEAMLGACRNGHVFSDHLSRCPECGARAAGGGRRAGLARSASSGTGSGESSAAVGAGGGGAGSGVLATLDAIGGAVFRPADDLLSRGARELAGFGGELLGGMAALGAIPSRALRWMLGGMPGGRAALGSARGQRQAISWTAVTAILGAALALGAGGLLSMLHALVMRRLALSGASAAMSPAGLWAGLVGGASLMLLAAFRELDGNPGHRWDRVLARRAAVRGLSGLAGWALGWLGLGFAWAATTGEPILRSLSGGLGTAGDPGADLRWTLTWAVFGAIGGSAGARHGQRPAGWLLAGAIFGAVGWAAVRVLGG